MKNRKEENNPIVRKDDLEVYLSKEDNEWLRNYIKKILTEEGGSKPTWLIKIIKDTIKNELTNNLKIHLSGYSSIRADISYDGHTITSASKYLPR